MDKSILLYGALAVGVFLLLKRSHTSSGGGNNTPGGKTIEDRIIDADIIAPAMDDAPQAANYDRQMEWFKDRQDFWLNTPTHSGNSQSYNSNRLISEEEVYQQPLILDNNNTIKPTITRDPAEGGFAHNNIFGCIGK